MWVYQLQSGTMGPSTCSEGEMVNSCSAHLEGEWAEVEGKDEGEENNGPRNWRESEPIAFWAYIASS